MAIPEFLDQDRFYFDLENDKITTNNIAKREIKLTRL